MYLDSNEAKAWWTLISVVSNHFISTLELVTLFVRLMRWEELISYGPICFSSPLFMTTVSLRLQWLNHLGFSTGVFLGCTGSHSWFNIFSPLLSTSAAQMSGAVRQVCVYLFTYTEAQAALYKYSSAHIYFSSCYSLLIILFYWAVTQPVGNAHALWVSLQLWITHVAQILYPAFYYIGIFLNQVLA